MVGAVKSLDEHKYVCMNGKIGYDEFTGISFGKCYGYLTIFAYFMEFEINNVTKEKLDEIIGIDLACGNYSYINILSKYCKIFGVTGTLESSHLKTQEILKYYFPR